MLLLLSSLLACQVMDSPGQVFSPVSISTDTTSKVRDESDIGSDPSYTEDTPDAEPTVAVDPLFADPQEDVIQMGAAEPKEASVLVEEPTTIEVPAADLTIESQDQDSQEVVSVVAVPVESPVVPSNLASFRPATVKDGWRPTLIGTLMAGPTPRAILAMPNGDEKVIHAGDMLSEDGVVVMAIGTNYVELAVIRSAEGRAQIENLTLSTQF